MVLVYHGTDTKSGISIARRGAILSNLEKRIEWFKQLYNGRSSRSFEKDYPGKTIEQIALEFESRFYGKSEIEARIKCLAVTKTIESTIDYAMRYEEYDGGLTLGIEIDDFYFERLDRHYGNYNIKFVPRKLSIEKLKELYLSPKAKEKHESTIKQEFKKYNLSYYSHSKII
jgi:hypothetical protein